MYLHIQRSINEIEAGRAGHGGGERRCRKGWVVRRRPRDGADQALSQPLNDALSS